MLLCFAAACRDFNIFYKTKKKDIETKTPYKVDKIPHQLKCMQLLFE